MLYLHVYVFILCSHIKTFKMISFIMQGPMKTVRETPTGSTAEWQTFTHLVGVIVEVKVLQEARGELAEQRVVGLVDGSQAPVGVVVGAGAGAESTH